ncbi:hypothetical protein [Labilithrix luteola]|uniref:hypothetical protein n=1 Tax=Labilithrix luteola TaxID=1391654 RepID=UPI0014764CD8|nr:hypothetical protein [Labilithrix luteola]
MRRLLAALAVCSALGGPGLAQAADSPALGAAEALAPPPWLGVQMTKGGEPGVGVEHVVRDPRPRRLACASATGSWPSTATR